MADKFSDILINPTTAKQVRAFICRPSHGLLVTGVQGTGKKDIARLMAAELLETDADKIDGHPYFFVISKEDGKSEISIDAARQLIKKLALKVPSANGSGQIINRIALIEGAGQLSAEAQNAILKLLEEPPEGSLVILTALSETDLLPTVSSRLQRLTVLPAGLDESLRYFSDEYPKKEVESAWQLSHGAAGLMRALLGSSDEHPLSLAVGKAKELLKLNAYQRVIFMQAMAKDKAELHTFLEALSKILKALHETAITQRRQSNSSKLLQARKLVSKSLDSAELNTNPRLVALYLAVRIRL